MFKKKKKKLKLYEKYQHKEIYTTNIIIVLLHTQLCLTKPFYLTFGHFGFQVEEEILES